MKILKYITTVLFGAVILLCGWAYFAYDNELFTYPADTAESFYIEGGLLFNGTGDSVTGNPGILVSNGSIACIGVDCSGESATVINASGMTILPGLIDLHTHFFARTREDTGMSLPGFIWNMARFKPNIRRALLEAGVTSMRSVGDPRDVILDLKKQLAQRRLAGPRLYVAGPIFTVPGGHPAYGGQDPNRSGYGGNMAFQSSDIAEISAEMEHLRQVGVDGIKLVYHGARSDNGEILLPTFTEDIFRQAVSKARSEGLWVAVHTGPQDETRIAADAGATTIEHGVRGGNLVDPLTLNTLVNNNVTYVPTLGREPQGYLNIPALYQAGVTLGVGTDTNNTEMTFGESYHEELQRMHQAGLPVAEVLLAATRNGAAALQQDATLGTIEAGKTADIILVDDNPLADLANLSKVRLVFQNGVLLVDNRY